MSIKVLVIANYRPTVAVRSEAEIFIALQKDFGYDITIMTFADSEYVERFKSVGIRVIDFHPEAKFKPAYIRRIREELCTGNYQVMHLFNNKAMINGLLAAINIPVKVAIYRGYTGNINWWDPFMYLKYLSPRVDKIVCLVEAIRVLIRKNLFFNKDKAITINKGHDVNWYNNTVPVDLGLPQNAFKITCVANIRPMKGLQYLLKATHYLSKDSNIHILLMGRGMDHPRFKKLIDDSPIKNQIINLGYRKDVLNVVKASDAFVLPSIKGEAITKSVIEAMCLEVAPIITDIPGNVGLVIDGDSGLVVPPHNAKALADAMVKLSSDKDLTIRLGKKAREHIDKNLNTRDTVKAFDAMYKDLVAS
ncbi:MAG: glycosyltransferase [Cytophagia bacterium]|nr:glycosyltransferase [Cytophagia bacterium]